jgi:DinB superfamily
METTATISSPIITNALLKALDMAFLGDETNQGWLNGTLFSLEKLSPEDASRSPAPDRPTPAAHADHIRVTLQAVQAWAKGENPQVDWAASWKIKNLNQEQWQDLRASLRAEFENTQELIHSEINWTEETLTSAINNISHAAYHASAIRQLIKL